MKQNIAVIGVGNMARAIITGILSSSLEIENFYLYDKNPAAYESFSSNGRFVFSADIETAIKNSSCILISVKPQNYPEVLDEIKGVSGYERKLYISIGAGITSDSVSQALNGAVVIRVLPNLPMTIGCGVSAICKNDKAEASEFALVKSIFESAGSTLIIDEDEMNRIIGVTSSSPAYVFKFIDAICAAASEQGLDGNALISTVCDVVIGSAMLLKSSGEKPKALISRVASKGGTTEQALNALAQHDFDTAIKDAMCACTARADELGKK